MTTGSTRITSSYARIGRRSWDQRPAHTAPSPIAECQWRTRWRLVAAGGPVRRQAGSRCYRSRNQRPVRTDPITDSSAVQHARASLALLSLSRSPLAPSPPLTDSPYASDLRPLPFSRALATRTRTLSGGAAASDPRRRPRSAFAALGDQRNARLPPPSAPPRRARSIKPCPGRAISQSNVGRRASAAWRGVPTPIYSNFQPGGVCGSRRPEKTRFETPPATHTACPARFTTPPIRTRSRVRFVAIVAGVACSWLAVYTWLCSRIGAGMHKWVNILMPTALMRLVRRQRPLRTGAAQFACRRPARVAPSTRWLHSTRVRVATVAGRAGTWAAKSVGGERTRSQTAALQTHCRSFAATTAAKERRADAYVQVRGEQCWRR